MMIINKNISQTPYYTETPITTMAMPVSPLSTYNAAYSSPCPSMALAMELSLPQEKPTPSKKRKCRKVGFGPEVTLAYIESAFDYTQEDRDDRWYRSSTISGFKDDARRLCRGRIEDVRNGCSPRRRVRKSLSSSSDEQSNDSIRGLDVYAPSRQRYSKKYTQHVLEAYHVRCVGNNEHVALLAEKWSKKSLQRAMNMGEKDFMAAYFSKEDDIESLSESRHMPSTLMRDSQHVQQKVPKILATMA
mmetsp:Transcript_19571/g.48740  ORF Transcript_19571/g.48740 Transcript_19571/m.48740 type:complete len:246 (-) Transcript_19571:70-807(-)